MLLNIPPPALLPGSSQKLPYFFVGLMLFKCLKIEWNQEPYTQTGLTNEKRRMVESVFGILATRFGVFILFDPIKVKKNCCELLLSTQFFEKIPFIFISIIHISRRLRIRNNTSTISGSIPVDTLENINKKIRWISRSKHGTNTIHFVITKVQFLGKRK